LDKLPADQQAAIAKSSSDRLHQTLLSAGEEATVSTMDRGTLKDAAAKQKLQGPAEPSSLERELALRRLELEFKLEMKTLEKQHESEKLECQRRERERERGRNSGKRG